MGITNQVSVVVPVYNVEEQLDRCIESIIAQTYSFLEIILVDDGSTDSCPQKCELWQKKDPRVRVIHKENGGLSSARNAGLSVAKGEFISFVDSDDYIETTFLESLVTSIKASDAGIAECGVRQEFENGQFKLLLLKNGVCNHVVATEHLLKNDSAVYSFVHNKLFKSSVIGEFRFSESLRYAEDTPFVFEVIQNCQNYCQIQEPLYHYVMRENSLVSGGFSTRKMADITAAKLILKRCNTDFPDYFDLALCHISLRGYYLLRQLLLTPNWKKDYSNEHSEIMSAMRKCTFQAMVKYQGLYRSIIWWMAKNMTPMYAIFLRFKKRGIHIESKSEKRSR